MKNVRIEELNDLPSVLEELAPGDCVEAESLAQLADSGKELLENEEIKEAYLGKKKK